MVMKSDKSNGNGRNLKTNNNSSNNDIVIVLPIKTIIKNMIITISL